MTGQSHSSPSTPDDETLAVRAIDDQAAFTELYRRHFTKVYRYHVAHAGNVPDAQDLTAETFMAALENLKTYRGKGSFCAWLFGIARHKVAMRFRSRKPEVSLEDAIGFADPSPGPELVAGQSLQLTQVFKYLRELTPERAEALVLCIFSDLTAAEAGQVIGKSEAAMKMLVFRGLKDLREKCSFCLQEEK